MSAAPGTCELQPPQDGDCSLVLRVGATLCVQKAQETHHRRKRGVETENLTSAHSEIVDRLELFTFSSKKNFGVSFNKITERQKTHTCKKVAKQKNKNKKDWV